MDYKQIIDKLVRELSFRVGIPNIHNKEHQSIMSEILSEWGEYEVKNTIFEFLTEKENKNDDRYVRKGRYFKLKGKESAEDPTYSKDEKGSYIKMDDKGIPNFIEANLMPGLQKGYFYRSCSMNLKINYEQMITKISQNALNHPRKY